jgi:hypothetical protein
MPFYHILIYNSAFEPTIIIILLLGLFSSILFVDQVYKKSRFYLYYSILTGLVLLCILFFASFIGKIKIDVATLAFSSAACFLVCAFLNLFFCIFDWYKDWWMWRLDAEICRSADLNVKSNKSEYLKEIRINTTALLKGNA